MFRQRFSQLSFLSRRYNSNPQHKLVRVNAIDHDNCFGAPDIDTSLIKTYHAPVLDYLLRMKQEKSIDIEYVISSSNRQSIKIDCLNAISNQNNLVLPVALAIAKALNAYFDPLLLSDITANQKPGFNVSLLKQLALKNNVNLFSDSISDHHLRLLMNEEHPHYCFSEDKINIIYAFMHRISLLHPNALIYFDVYDDLHDSVLNPLLKFYADNPDRVPQNMILSFYQYKSTSLDYSHASNELPSLIGVVQGIGVIDRNYYQTVNAMTTIAEEIEGIKPIYNMAKYMSSSKIDAMLNATESNPCRGTFKFQ